MVYSRPWLSYAQQLARLQARGMTITDEPAALDYLERIGYYRLSGYWYPFRCFETVTLPDGKLGSKATDQFVSNTHFVDAVELYLFDKQLRMLVMDALERIEVALRVDVAYLLGERDPFAHLDPRQFHPSFIREPFYRGSRETRFEAWLTKYQGLVKRSKEDFVRHYHLNHGDKLPIWVAVELFDFGALSQLLSMMTVPDQTRIAAKYGVDWQVLNSWVFALSYLRNLSAHHSRMWNRNITTKPRMPKPGQLEWCDHLAQAKAPLSKPFVLLAIIRHLVQVICPNTHWHCRLRDHLLAFPAQYSDRKLGLGSVGVTEDWLAFWLVGRWLAKRENKNPSVRC